MSRAKLSFATVVLGYLVLVARAQSSQEMLQEAGNVIGQAVEFISSCGEKDITVCLKERALKLLDATPANIELTEGVSLKETNPKEDEAQNVSNPSLPEEPRARENAIDSLLMDRLTNFLSSHTLEFKLPNSAVSEMKRELDADEGRKKKKKKMLLPLLILLKLKAVVLLPLILGAIALIAFKSLIIGKVALVVTGLVALKKLLEHKETSQSYEVVAHPHHSHSHVTSFDEHHSHHGHAPYKRAFIVEDPQNIAYSAYVNNQQLFETEKI